MIQEFVSQELMDDDQYSENYTSLSVQWWPDFSWELYNLIDHVSYLQAVRLGLKFMLVDLGSGEYERWEDSAMTRRLSGDELSGSEKMLLDMAAKMQALGAGDLNVWFDLDNMKKTPASGKDYRQFQDHTHRTDTVVDPSSIDDAVDTEVHLGNS